MQLPVTLSVLPSNTDVMPVAVFNRNTGNFSTTKEGKGNVYVIYLLRSVRARTERNFDKVLIFQLIENKIYLGRYILIFDKGPL